MEAQQSAGMAADLAARLTKRLGDLNSDRNLVFSPLSIHAVLALLAAGAAGDTLEEILRVLGARSRSELEDSVARLLDGPLRDRSSEPDGAGDGPSVAFACGVWSDLTRVLNPAFRDAVVGKYKAEASSVDFRNDPERAKARIDAWAAAATRNLIKSAVPPDAVHRRTDVVLANAVYFRGKWDKPFYESSTENRPFYRLDGTAVDVPFMKNYGRHLIAEHDGFKVLVLRYKASSSSSGHGMCMCIFLPDARDGLASLLDKITSSPSSKEGFLREHLPTRSVGVGKFGVPKFALSFESSLVGVLNHLGLLLPFTLDADLSEMLEDGASTRVQDVFHKAVIEVNEEGTKAAAVTTAYFSNPTCAPDMSRRVDFVADHPFAYFIIEEASHAVLFAGHVVDPGNGAAAVIPSPAPFRESATTKRGAVMNQHPAYRTLFYAPASPVYRPASPVYNPHSPVQGPGSPPVYRPRSLPYSHGDGVPYSAQSPANNPAFMSWWDSAFRKEYKDLPAYSPEEAATGEDDEVPPEKKQRRGEMNCPEEKTATEEDD